MIFGIYDPPHYGSDTQDWSILKIGDICDAVDFDYIKYFCGAGTFTLIVPRNSVYADKIYVGCFLFQNGSKKEDGFIVKNIVYENDTLKITGYDLNGLLLDRVTLYPTESADKAVKAGSTEEIVKYYVDYNCVSSADEERNFPRLGIAENRDRGAVNDAASPRLECVADVIADILGAQNMGYRIRPIFNVTGKTAALLEFEVYEAVDRTQNQNENNRVVFSFGLGNVTQMKREIGVTADKNTFYCELSSGAVQRYYKKNEPEDDGEDAVSDDVEEPADINLKSGYERREEYLKLNCELNEIEIYAEHEIADRYRLTDSLEITAGNPLDYGDVYNVGDIVTVFDRERNVQLDSIISAVETKRTGTEYSVKITLGDSKPKVLDSYVKKGQATANTVRSSSGGNTIPVTNYEYLADNSVKMNGVTYTIKKNAAGLISKITDNTGGELEPEISGDISDTALHNAVFWAVAMARGLKRGETDKNVMPVMIGITGYFTPETLALDANGVFAYTWNNYLAEDAIHFNKAVGYVLEDLNKGALQLNGSCYGEYTSSAEFMTVYAVFKARNWSSSKYTPVVTKEMQGSLSTYHAFDIMIATNGSVVLECRSSYALSSIGATGWHVVCITRGASMAKLYIDGVYIGETQSLPGEYAGKFCINRSIRNGAVEDFPGYNSYNMLAFGLEEHTSEQVIRNSEWLMKKYLNQEVVINDQNSNT